MKIFRIFYGLFLEKIIQKIKMIIEAKGKKKIYGPVTEKFLLSDEYEELMSRHLLRGQSYDLYEAQNKTANFCFRHFEQKERLGVFRWRGIQRNLHVILPLVKDENRFIIDFGGAASPLGFNSKIVDFQKKDSWGRDVPFANLQQVDQGIDVFFSSHCLEHIPELEKTLEQIHHLMNQKGWLILHLPSFSCDRWRAGIHQNKKYKNHYWTFCLKENEDMCCQFVHCIAIDELVEKFFQLHEAEYCGDDSIFILAKKSEILKKGIQ